MAFSAMFSDAHWEVQVCTSSSNVDPSNSTIASRVRIIVHMPILPSRLAAFHFHQRCHVAQFHLEEFHASDGGYCAYSSDVEVIECGF
jgi:hypothetical protein